MDDFRTTEIIFGPQHPGIHGNFAFRLELDGDIVRRARVVPGFLHRAFEKLMEQRTWMQNVALVPRICVPDPDVNEAAYSMAIEDIMGLEVPRRADYIRTIVLGLQPQQTGRGPDDLGHGLDCTLGQRHRLLR